MTDSNSKVIDPNDEQLIAIARKYLQYSDPVHSSRDDAVSLLNFMRTTAKLIAKEMSIDELNNYYDKYKQNNK